MPGIFITGTDTGVGKTYLVRVLAEYFRTEGIDMGIMKPISAGPKAENDALTLKKALQLKDPLSLINPIALKLPLAPYVACNLLKRKIRLKKVFSAYKKLEQQHDLILVEGIGGALVPITQDYFVADLIQELRLSALIVARAGLGTINHTLLTVAALEKRKIKIIGIALNGFRGKDLAEETNAQAIEALTHLPVIKIKWQKTTKN